jgi:hypothetical protein
MVDDMSAGLTHDRMIAMLRDIPDANPDSSSDYRNSVSGAVIRCKWEGRHAVAVQGERSLDVKVGALLDLIALDNERRRSGQSDGKDDTVALILGFSEVAHQEAIEALCTLRAAYMGSTAIRIVVEGEDGVLADSPDGAKDFSRSSSAVRWLALMSSVDFGPPPLVAELIQRVRHPALRAYPMLSQWPMWSIRLEGLIVGKADESRGVLDVGKLGKTVDISR